MKIKMLVAIAGPEWSANVDHIVDRPDDEAKALIEGRYATEVAETTEAAIEAEIPETPSAPVETAVKATPNVQVAAKPRG